MIIERKHILIKGYLVAALLGVVAIVIGMSILKIQIEEGAYLEGFAQKNNFRLVVEESNRGNLYALNGVLLATTLTKHNIYVDLATIKDATFEEGVMALSDSLGRMFRKPSIYFEMKLRRERKNKSRYMLLVKDLNDDEYKRIRSFPIFKLGQNKGGLIHETESKRELVSSDMSARTIGFDDARGKSGLEGAYSDYLRGVEGRRWEQFMGKGKWKPSKAWEQEPEKGASVYTTIDIDLQSLAYNALNKQLQEYEAEHGSVIVMEVETGKIKAMVNLKRMKKGSYADVYNYAVGEGAEPGSTFKAVSLLAGLDDGYFNRNTIVETGDGKYKLYGRTISDTSPNGTLTVKSVMVKSSNIGSAKLINQHYGSEPEKFIKKLGKWKLLEPMGLDIPGEAIPNILTPDNPSWSKITLPVMSYGYGFKLTAMQILTFYNGIANDGMMLKPMFLEKTTRFGEEDKLFKPQVLVQSMASKEAISAMQNMLKETVATGTGKGISTESYSIAGKTGTSRVEYWIKNQPMQYRASFVGYFPSEKPKYSCIVVVHKPNREKGYYGGGVTATVFKTIADWVSFKTPINIPSKKDTQNIISSLERTAKFEIKSQDRMPRVVGYPGKDVIPALENLGMDVRYMGIGKIKEQSIEPGIKIKKGETVYLTLEG